MAVFQFLAAAILSLWHPYHVSMTDINLNDKSHTLEVSIKLFTEDFESALHKNCNCKVDLSNNAAGSLVSSYISQHLQILLDNKKQPLSFSGFRQIEESTWCYFEVNDVKQLHKLELTNTLLHDYFTDQSNLLHIKAVGREVNDKLDCPQSKYVTTF